MNSLKKALTKDDPKKYPKSKIEISGLKHTTQWQDIDSLIEKVAVYLVRRYRERAMTRLWKRLSKKL
jgi:hypothetical protein